MTLEVTAPEIAAHHVHSLVRRLHDADYRLPDEIHDDILALGQAAVPALLEILEDALSKSPVDGWVPLTRRNCSASCAPRTPSSR